MGVEADFFVFSDNFFGDNSAGIGQTDLVFLDILFYKIQGLAEVLAFSNLSEK